MTVRWLDIAFLKMEILRFTSVFLDKYHLIIIFVEQQKASYLCKTTSKEFFSKDIFHKSYATTVAMATMTFQRGGYFGFKVTL